jgi:hypothetical protein
MLDAPPAHAGGMERGPGTGRAFFHLEDRMRMSHLSAAGLLAAALHAPGAVGKQIDSVD